MWGFGFVRFCFGGLVLFQASGYAVKLQSVKANPAFPPGYFGKLHSDLQDTLRHAASWIWTNIYF